MNERPPVSPRRPPPLQVQPPERRPGASPSAPAPGRNKGAVAPPEQQEPTGVEPRRANEARPGGALPVAGSLHTKPQCDLDEMGPAAALIYHVCLLNSVLERAGNREAEQHGLTLPQWMALGCIGRAGEDGVAHSELGNRLMLSKAPITGVVDRLERGGYVNRTADRKDRRISRIVITPRGEEKWRNVRHDLRAMAKARCGCLSEQEMQTIIALLGRLLDSVATADPTLANPS